jgi:hypothetical protein
MRGSQQRPDDVAAPRRRRHWAIAGVLAVVAVLAGAAVAYTRAGWPVRPLTAHSPAVRVGAPRGITPAPVTGGGYVVGSGPSAMRFPQKPGLTVATSSLREYTGSRTFSSGVTNLSNCIISEQLRVNRGATLNLTNCWIKVNTYDAGYGMIGKAGTINLNHVLVDGTGFDDVVFPVIFEGGGSSLLSEYRGNSDNARIDSDVDFEWNWIHDPKTRTATGGAHSDGVEVYYGSGWRVSNNFIDIGGAEGQNSCINVTNDFGPVHNGVVSGNTCLSGGNVSFYFRGDGYCGCGGPLANIVVTLNRLFAGADGEWGGYYGTHSYKPAQGITLWQGNTLRKSNGAVVAIPLGEWQP